MVKMNMSELAACIHSGKAVVVCFNNIGIVGIDFEDYAMELDSDTAR
jgi:hypothetical protein